MIRSPWRPHFSQSICSHGRTCLFCLSCSQGYVPWLDKKSCWWLIISLSMMAIEIITSNSLFCLARNIKLFWLFSKYSPIPLRFIDSPYKTVVINKCYSRWCHVFGQKKGLMRLRERSVSVTRKCKCAVINCRILELSILQKYTRKSIQFLHFCVFWSGLILQFILTSWHFGTGTLPSC